jgi:hypothetical protein
MHPWWALSALCAFYWMCINCTTINIKIYMYIFILLAISTYRKLIKYRAANRSTVICNNEKTITEMTTVNSKLMTINLDYKSR